MRRTYSILLVGALLAYVLSFWMAKEVFHRAPITTDEQSYLFQAHLLAEGKIKRPAPIYIEAFRYPMIILDEHAGWLSRYPPGHSLWLVPGVWAGSPYIMIALAAALGLALTALAAIRIGGSLPVVLVGFLLSPFFLFTYGTMLSHTSGLVATAGMLLGYILWQQTGRRGWALLAGLMWSWLFLNRTYSALLVALPFAVDALWQLGRRRDKETFWGTAFFAGSAFVGVVAILAYNYAAVGHPFHMTYLHYDPTDQLGFGLRHHWTTFPAPEPVDHSFAKGLSDLQGNLLMLDRWMWGVPGGLAVWLGLTIIGWSKRWSLLLVASVVSVCIGYVFFWYPGWNETGPNYYFEVFPAMVLSASLGVRVLGKRMRSLPRAVPVAMAAVGILLWSSIAVPFAVRQGSAFRADLALRAQLFELFRTAPPKTIIFVRRDDVERAWKNHDLVFNRRGLEDDVIVARWMDTANKSMMKYFDDYTPVALRKRGGEFHLIPMPEEEPIDISPAIGNLHRYTGTNILDTDEDGHERLVRIAREGEHGAEMLVFGRYYFIFPGRFAVEFEVKSQPGPAGGDVMRLEVAADRGRYVIAEQTIGLEEEWRTVRIEFESDAFVTAEPRVWYLGTGTAQIASVRLMEIVD